MKQTKAQSAQHAKLVERMMDAWNSHRVADLAEIYASNYRGLDVTDGSNVDGPSGVAQQVQRYVHAFPDVLFQTVELIEQGDEIAVHWTMRGTHQGILLNLPPSGRRVEIQGMTFLTIAGNKITQSISLWDLAGLLRVIGLLPELATD